LGLPEQVDSTALTTNDEVIKPNDTLNILTIEDPAKPTLKLTK